MKNKLYIIVFIIAAISSAVGIALYFVSYQTHDDRAVISAIRKSDVYLEQTNTSYEQAVKNADSSVIRAIPRASELSAESAQDIATLFDLSRLTYSFRINDRTVEYLVKILDSNSAESEPYKSIAAYFLLHVFYDSGGDIALLINSINASEFMRSLTQEAKTVFPTVFAVAPEEMTYTQKAKYFTSYLVVLSGRGDTTAIPANAATEISNYYISAINSKTRDEKVIKKYEDMLHEQLNIAVSRVDAITSPNFGKKISAHDTVVGLNHLANTVNNLRQFKADDQFPEIKNIDTTNLFDASYKIASKEAIGLDMYTTFLYATHLAKYSDTTAENNQKINNLIRRIVGDAPFQNVSKFSWATKRFINSKSGRFSNVYRRENIAAIARRSSLLREFLKTKDGWTDKDFELRDDF